MSIHYSEPTIITHGIPPQVLNSVRKSEHIEPGFEPQWQGYGELSAIPMSLGGATFSGISRAFLYKANQWLTEEQVNQGEGFTFDPDRLVFVFNAKDIVRVSYPIFYLGLPSEPPFSTQYGETRRNLRAFASDVLRKGFLFGPIHYMDLCEVRASQPVPIRIATEIAKGKVMLKRWLPLRADMQRLFKAIRTDVIQQFFDGDDATDEVDWAEALWVDEHYVPGTRFIVESILNYNRMVARLYEIDFSGVMRELEDQAKYYDWTRWWRADRTFKN